MLNANYVRHLTILGKLCNLYDSAGTTIAELETLIENTVEQDAKDATGAWSNIRTQLPYVQQAQGAVNSGVVNLQAIAIQAALAYLVDANFYDDLTTVPSPKGNAAASLAALQTDMSAGVDNKTLTTLASTGLVNFFNECLAAQGQGVGTWNTSNAPTYADGTYVVSTVL